MKKMLGIAILVTASFAAGCATPTVVQEREITDNNLDCAQLLMEIAEAEHFEKEARQERGITGTNVAAAVFFWPALAATYVNTDNAIDAAEDRRSYLMERYIELKCAP